MENTFMKWFALVLIGLLAACTAEIPNGVLGCPSGNDNECPTGFFCHSDQLCYDEPESNAGTGGTGGTSGTGGASGTSGSGGDEMDGGRDDASTDSGTDASIDSGTDSSVDSGTDANDGYVPPSCDVDNGGCDDNASCTVADAGIACTCNAYWEDDNAGGCRDINECSTDNGGCGVGVSCINNTGAAPGCGCPSGYSGSSPNCIDIDECEGNTDDCAADQFCTNTPGSFTCTDCTTIPNCNSGLTCTNANNSTCGTCNTGYAGTTACIDINECVTNADNCHANAACTNNTGSFTCACNSGYRGNGTSCTACDVIPNCASGITCSTANNETCGTCSAGYVGNGTATCTDINECTTNADNCDGTPDACVNTVGSFMCECPPGYIGNGVGNSGCVSECLTGNGGCDSLTTCSVNSNGVVCGACPVGYTGTGATACTPRLTGLTLSVGALSPALSANTTAYSVDVGLVDQTIALTPTAPQGVAITVAGTGVASGAQWTSSTLNLGNNTITIVVSQTGHPSRMYSFTVRRGRQEVYLKANNAEPQDRFGIAVALSADGDTMAIGADLEDSATSAVVNGTQSSSDNSATNSGAVYVFTRSNSVWSQQAYIKPTNTGAGDAFGAHVGLSADGNVLAVGARLEDGVATDSGAVYVFTRSSSVWSQQAYIKPTNPGDTDLFGPLAVSGDGNTLAVGAIYESSAATGVGGNETDNSAYGSGAVYVFTRSGSNWSQQAYLKAANTDAEDFFGYAVALSANGNTLAVGARDEDSGTNAVVNGNHAEANDSAMDSGAVYVFTRSVSTWSQQAYIKGSNAGAGDHFGRAVTLASADGNTLAVGADAEDDAASNSGAVYVFTRSGSNWSQEALVRASNPGAGDNFGTSVSLSANGNTLAVGAPYEDSAATGFGGNQSDNSVTDSGAVYWLTRSGSTWSPAEYMKASNTTAGSNFGEAVAVSADGRGLAVGAFEESSTGGTRSGAVYVFR